jgi:cytochrome c oxidase cbb3-type subunit 3
MKKCNLLIILSLLSATTFAQEVATDSTKVAEKASAATATFSSLSSTDILVIVLFVFTLLLLVVSYTLLKGLKRVLSETVKSKSPAVEEKKQKRTLWEKLLSLKPISAEKDLVIPHDYDGITELNNPTPSWFNWLFYGSIVFGIGYLYYYHIGEWGPRQDDEYKTELVEADAAKRIMLAKSGGAIDEKTVKIDATQIEKGKTIFGGNCAACHGNAGEGLVGPNLTDEFWLHGGSIHDIFKTIKYGVPEKGMVSWEKSMSAGDISAVANYIVSLKGTNPPNPKAPQGEKYVPEGK